MTRATLTVLSLFVVLAAASPGTAQADEPPAAHRAVPDYDGRPAREPDEIDALLWVPRVLTAPLYLVSEYLVRRPLGWLISELERSEVVDFLLGFFTAGGNEDFVILPTAFFDFGFAPSGGLYAAWRRFIVEENRISLHAASGGEDWLLATLSDHASLPDQMELRFRASALKRPDQQVGGIGYDGTQTPIARFGIEQIEGSVRYGLRPWPGIELDYTVGYRGVGYVDESWDGQPSVGQANRRDLPAFESGYSSILVHGRLVLDTRTGCGNAGRTSGWDTAQQILSSDERAELPDGACELASGGLRVALEASEHFGFGGMAASEWLRVAGEVVAATDFLGRGRVLSLRGRVHLVEPLGGARIVPFTELVSLSEAMRGFQPGRLYGATLASLSLEYVWPVWAFLDGSLHFDVGNVFDQSFQDFDVERLRMSFGVLLAPRASGDHLFELGLSFGTDTFARGASIVSVRFVIGARGNL
ncbi:MAG: BamA/TamA family outer membrane protein [Myxococcales bacterium]|nr:BamA/TamA family outer membrane protein [Myxococcales bacterium]